MPPLTVLSPREFSNTIAQLHKQILTSARVESILQFDTATQFDVANHSLEHPKRHMILVPTMIYFPQIWDAESSLQINTLLRDSPARQKMINL